MMKLAIIQTDDAGNVSGVVREIDECTLSEWDTWYAQIVENAEKARLFTENEARISLLLQAAAQTGIFRGNQINLDPVLRPYVENIITEYHMKKGMEAKLDHYYRVNRDRLKSWSLKIANKIGVPFLFKLFDTVKP